MHEERGKDFVWLLFIDHQSSATAHTRLSQPPHLMRCNLSQIKKAGAEEKQESSKLPTLSRIKKERNNKNKTKQKCWRAIFRWQALLMHKPKEEKQGEEGAAGLVFVSEMGFNKMLYTCDLTRSPSSLFPLFQHFSESVFRSSWEKTVITQGWSWECQIICRKTELLLLVADFANPICCPQNYGVIFFLSL